MKQMDECLDRVFQDKFPNGSSKWKAFKGEWLGVDPNLLLLYHYHHLVLVYDKVHRQILHEWHEVAADKRGLDAAKKYLEQLPR